MADDDGNTDGESGTDDTDQQVEQGQQAAEKPAKPEIDWKAKAREWETRAKANGTAAQRLQEIEDKNKTELQRAQDAATAADARAMQTIKDYGAKLVRAQFDTLAARRNPDAKTSDILEYVDLSRLVDENGDPDMKALQAAVLRLVPEPAGGNPALEGGSRRPPKAGQDMETLLRQAAGRG